MNVFAVIATKTETVAPLQAAVESKFAGNHIKVADNTWFIAGTGTAREISDVLGIAGKTMGTLTYVIVLSVTSYWGNAETSIWEWIKNRLEAKQNA